MTHLLIALGIAAVLLPPTAVFRYREYRRRQFGRWRFPHNDRSGR